jgi:hypothetical protein
MNTPADRTAKADAKSGTPATMPSNSCAQRSRRIGALDSPARLRTASRHAFEQLTSNPRLCLQGAPGPARLFVSGPVAL